MYGTYFPPHGPDRSEPIGINFRSIVANFFSNPDRSKFLEIDERVRNQSSSNLFCLMSLNSPFMTIFHKLPLTKESQSPVNFYGADLFPLFLASNDLVSRVL